MDLELRASVVEDTDELAPILHRAFSEFNISVGISPDVDFGTVESAGRELNTLFHSPCCGFTVLDKLSGQPIGAVFLNFPGERVQAVGPVFVDPSYSSKGVGKALMRAAVDKAKATNALSIRLVQGCFLMSSTTSNVDSAPSVRAENMVKSFTNFINSSKTISNLYFYMNSIVG